VSLQTTLARSLARQAAAAWRDHYQHCPPCDRWKRRHKGQRPCAVGAELSHNARELDAQLRRERELDRKPVGMGTLW